MALLVFCQITIPTMRPTTLPLPPTNKILHPPYSLQYDAKPQGRTKWTDHKNSDYQLGWAISLIKAIFILRSENSPNLI